MQQYSTDPSFLQIGILFAFLIPAILFLLAQQNTLKTIQPENRLMQPGMVWLQCIPVFGQYWQFRVVSRISDSIRQEIASRQDDSILGFADALSVEQLEKRPTFQIGIAYCILITIGVILAQIQVPLVQGWFSLAGMICWIIYWVQLAKWKRKLAL